MLILRSNLSVDQLTRIEISFKPVLAVGIPSSFPSLRIEAIVNGPEVIAAKTSLGRSPNLVPYEDEVLFRVSGGSSRGWILAYVVAGREDTETFDSPTMFDGNAPRPGVSEIFPPFPHSQPWYRNYADG